MDVDVLISGHTHTFVFIHVKLLGNVYLLIIRSFQAVEYDGKFFVNPGSATGAWTPLIAAYVEPLFMFSRI